MERRKIMRNVFALLVVTVFGAVLLLGGCGGDGGDTDSGDCSPLAATDFPCANPNECLSVTATWCFPGATSCTNLDADLSLELPGGGVIGVGNGEFPNANGCSHDGDEQGNVLDPDADGVTGPYNETITCSPFVHALPPDRIDAGRYVIEVDEFNILETDILLDINVDGRTSCQIVNTDPAPVRVEVVYP